MRITNKKNLPAALVAAVANKKYSGGASDLTASQITTPPQIIRLKKTHADELVEDASDRVWALYGEAMHAILEAGSGHGELVEQRFHATYNVDGKGFSVSGQADNLDLIGGVLTDYKTTSVWNVKNGAKPEWTAQLNVLALLLRANGYTVNKLQIVALCRDWRPSEKLRYPDYPDKVESIPLEIWEVDKTKQVIAKALREAYLDETVRPCTPEERWQKDTVYAVMKTGRKSAVSLFSTRHEAEAVVSGSGKGFYIQERPGENVRCEQYCPVKNFCPQYAVMNQEKTNETV